MDSSTIGKTNNKYFIDDFYKILAFSVTPVSEICKSDKIDDTYYSFQ